MHWQCTFCDTKSANRDDERFNSCKQNDHRIVKMFSRAEIRDASSKDIPRESTSKLIYEFMKSRIKKLVVSDNDSSQVFALIENNGHNEILDLSNGKAEGFVPIYILQRNRRKSFR